MITRDFSKATRIMHWLLAITVALLLVTIFLRLKWMDNRYMSNVIEDKLQKNGLTMEKREIRRTAGAIQHNMWKWHVYLGYALTGIYALRFLLPIGGKMKLKNPFKSGLDAKRRFEAWVYSIFYACMGISLATGLWIELGPRKFHGQMEDIHVLSIYYLVAFILIHLGGVLRAEFTKEKGIISRMISGE